MGNGLFLKGNNAAGGSFFPGLSIPRLRVWHGRGERLNGNGRYGGDVRKDVGDIYIAKAREMLQSKDGWAGSLSVGGYAVQFTPKFAMKVVEAIKSEYKDRLAAAENLLEYVSSAVLITEDDAKKYAERVKSVEPLLAEEWRLLSKVVDHLYKRFSKPTEEQLREAMKPLFDASIYKDYGVRVAASDHNFGGYAVVTKF